MIPKINSYHLINNLKRHLLIFSVAVTFFTTTIHAQELNGCHFLQGNFIEVGIAPNGAFGTPQNAPLGYHPRPTPFSSSLFNPVTGTFSTRPTSLGFVADYGKDGWDIGSPAFFGDYFMPGTVQEGWNIEMDGTTRGDAWSNLYSRNLGTGFTANLSGSLKSYSKIGNLITSVWEGNYDGKLSIRQTVTMDITKAYFIINVQLINTATTSLSNIYYLRTVDADCDVSISGRFTTNNYIKHTLPNATGKSLVTSTGTSFRNAYLGLGTKDCKAKPYFMRSGLFPVGTIKDAYNQLSPGNIYKDSSNADVAIGLAFEIGTLATNQEASFAYAYILNEDDLDDAFAATQPGFRYNSVFYPSGSVLVKPTGTPIDLEIVNGSIYTWNWSPPINLSTTVGLTTTATVDVFPQIYTVVGSGSGAGRCTSPNLEVTISPTPVIIKPTVVSSYNYCINDTPLPLEASGAGVLNWYNTPTGGVPSTTKPTPTTDTIGEQKFYVSLVSSLGESVRVPITITVFGLPIVSIKSSINEICFGDTLNLTSQNIASSYKWEFNNIISSNTSKSIRVTPPNTEKYYLTVIDSNKCTAKDSLIITVNQLPSISVNASPSKDVCPKDSVLLSAIASNITKYTWSPNVFLNTIDKATVVSKPNASTTYTIEVTDAKGCKNNNAISINRINFNKPNLGIDTAICINDSLVLNPGFYSSYLWQDGTLTNTFIAKSIGLYYVSVTDNFGCKDGDSLSITKFNPLPINFLPNDAIICRGTPYNLNIKGFKQYDWSNGDKTPNTTLKNLGKYFLLVQNANGCNGIDSISLLDARCVPFQIPNAFTPNNDGKNEIFKPLITQQLSNYLFRIYNRFGEIIFQTQDQSKGWNGKINAIPQTSGTFIYQISFLDFDGKPQKFEDIFLLIR